MKERTESRRAKLFDEIEIGELAKYFGVTPNTIENRLKTRKIPDRTVGGMLEFMKHFGAVGSSAQKKDLTNKNANIK